MLSTYLIIQLMALGLTTGFLAGLLGIGGGMMLVPFITYMLSQQQVAPDLAVKMAIATSMATILFTSISSVRATTSAVRCAGSWCGAWHRALLWVALRPAWGCLPC